MKIESFKYYKESYKKCHSFIYYLKTDGDSVYHYINYDRSLHKLKRYEVYLTSITEYNREYSNDKDMIIEELSIRELEYDLLLEMI